MLAELEVVCPAQAVPGRLRQVISDNFELEVPFNRLGLPAVGKFSRQASVTLGEARSRQDGATIIPIVWRDARSSNFPEFKGYIEVIALASDRSQIAVVGDYVPPMGPLGAIFDASIGKHIAQVTVEELLDHLRTALETRDVDSTG